MRKRRLVVDRGASARARFWARSSTAGAPNARRTRVDLYFDDGSMVSLEAGPPDADRMLPLAGDVLEAAGRSSDRVCLLTRFR